MKAIIVPELGAASLVDWPEPRPNSHDVIVDVATIELNYPDLLMIDGRYQVKPALPFMPGKSAVGCVRSLGAQATGFAIGYRVLYGLSTAPAVVRTGNELLSNSR
ncbi:MAG: alcohol dehydrogenase catalytic domain-containing protein [Hyphomicrobiaceae bacterium]